MSGANANPPAYDFDVCQGTGRWSYLFYSLRKMQSSYAHEHLNSFAMLTSILAKHQDRIILPWRVSWPCCLVVIFIRRHTQGCPRPSVTKMFRLLLLRFVIKCVTQQFCMYYELNHNMDSVRGFCSLNISLYWNSDVYGQPIQEQKRVILRVLWTSQVSHRGLPGAANSPLELYHVHACGRTAY